MYLYNQTMRNLHSKKLIKATLMLVFLSFFMQSCHLTSKILVEKDIVYSSKRIKWNYTYTNRSRKSHLLWLEQSVVKEIKANNEISYKVYDVLTFSSKSFQLEDRVFLIIDNEVLPVILENLEYENVKNIVENREDVVTSDSTKVSVVTGYSEDNMKIAKISYELNNEVVDKIRNSNQVLFRYYSGPDMVTLKLKGFNLNRLKKVLNES
ncbi:MAG: hypothetical protein FD170_2046 [Bacteroidetes bacterium]|nr:MAG: hypothetical protein FD170_2046 [Bacteroidota bacterium]